MADYARRRTAGTKASSDLKEAGLKSFAALTKAAAATSAAAPAAVAKLNAFLDGLAPLELYRDWAPPAADAPIALTVAPASAFASSKKGDDAAAAKALEEGAAAWTSGCVRPAGGGGGGDLAGHLWRVERTSTARGPPPGGGSSNAGEEALGGGGAASAALTHRTVIRGWMPAASAHPGRWKPCIAACCTTRPSAGRFC
jgi:hypothetical protein